MKAISQLNPRHIPMVAAGLLSLAAMIVAHESLGIAWLPVISYGLIASAAIGHRPSSFANHWKFWLVGAGGILISILIMGSLENASGASLAGEWGDDITRGNLRVAVLECILVVVFLLAVIPNPARERLLSLTTEHVVLVRNQDEADDANAAIAAPEPVVIPDPEPVADPDIHRSEWDVPKISAAKGGNPGGNLGKGDIQELTDLLENTAANYGVNVEVVGVDVAPRVLRFNLRPGLSANGAKGGATKVRVADITKLDREIALALKTPYIRINEWPEPGQDTISLEIPNPNPTRVGMADVIRTAEFVESANAFALPLALGLDVSNAPVLMDLAVAPHLLVAGATGAGKSVGLNALIASLLLTRTPEQVRLLLIDPKRVELTRYRGIPHLARPVVTDAEDALDALRELVDEVEHRYKTLEAAKVRNIDEYNAVPGRNLPRIVVVVDEIADLMAATNGQANQCLARIAQVGRAAGVHAVLATQRPSVKVITGELKGNIPARLAFATPTQVDSRVILDQNGAEVLTGQGDFLLSRSGISALVRGQGVYVDDAELDDIIETWRAQA